jgi:quercetin dioxygenase-like cupin family protein
MRGETAGNPGGVEFVGGGHIGCRFRQTGLMSLVVPPYPKARYTQDRPKISAWFKRADRQPDYQTPAVAYHYLANQQDTNGDYGLYRVDIAPAGGGPPEHFHRAMSEAFFVLSGTMRLCDGNEWTDGHQGDFLYIPPGGIHGFRNEADEPASLLMLFAPGAPREAYFEGFAALADMTDDERAEWFISHDNYWIQ